VGPQNDPQAAASKVGIEQSGATLVCHTPDHNSKTFQRERSPAAKGPFAESISNDGGAREEKSLCVIGFVALGCNGIWGCEDVTAPVFDVNAPGRARAGLELFLRAVGSAQIPREG